VLGPWKEEDWALVEEEAVHGRGLTMAEHGRGGYVLSVVGAMGYQTHKPLQQDHQRASNC